MYPLDRAGPQQYAQYAAVVGVYRADPYAAVDRGVGRATARGHFGRCSEHWVLRQRSNIPLEG